MRTTEHKGVGGWVGVVGSEEGDDGCTCQSMLNYC